MARLGAVTKVTTRMGNDRIQGIGCGAHYGGGFSRWHTRAVSWAVSAAFTFLLKIEDYGAGDRVFFSSPSLSLSFLSSVAVFSQRFVRSVDKRRRALRPRITPCFCSFSFPSPSLSLPPYLSVCFPLSRTRTTGGSLFVPAERGDTCHTGNQAPPRGCTCSLCWRFTRQNRKKVKVLRERESDARR